MSPEHSPFIRAICETPGDDTPRLVYADWLDEHGEPERAEFIRVQCELARMDEAGEGVIDPREGHTCCEDPCPVCASVEKYDALRRRERELWVALRETYIAEFLPGIDRTLTIDDPDLNIVVPAGRVRRGFVAEVTCTAAAFVGGECKVCEANPRHRNVPSVPWPTPCPNCNGTGRTPGIAAELFAAHPVERVTLTGIESSGPIEGGRSRGGFFWLRRDIPAELWALLWALLWSDGRDIGRVTSDSYPDRETALDALSAACVKYGRQAAGLST